MKNIASKYGSEEESAFGFDPDVLEAIIDSEAKKNVAGDKNDEILVLNSDVGTGCCYGYIDFKTFLQILLICSIIMIVAGSLWTDFVFTDAPECGITTASARFEVYTEGDTRYLVGNSCPGYDWTGQAAPYKAGEETYKWSLPSSPVNCTTSYSVSDAAKPVYSTIGYALNGVPIYGPLDAEGDDAVKSEAMTFDDCGGHVTWEELYSIDYVFAYLEPTGAYHYHQLPGDSDPLGHDDSMNVNYTLCSGVTQWYNESTDTHSPIAGFMLDGYPIYGPKGDGGNVPDNLDMCGGHSSDLGFYHYHFKSEFPYTVNCLWGRTDGQANSFLGEHSDCEASEVQWDMSELTAFHTSFGGDGDNSYPASGCLSVLVLGVIFFLYSSVHLLMIYMDEARQAGEGTTGGGDGPQQQEQLGEEEALLAAGSDAQGGRQR